MPEKKRKQAREKGGHKKPWTVDSRSVGFQESSRVPCACGTRNNSCFLLSLLSYCPGKGAGFLEKGAGFLEKSGGYL